MKQRPFAVFDIDGTLIRWQLYHAIVETLTRQGKIPTAVAARIDEARAAWKNRGAGQDGFGVYEEILVKGYHEALKTLQPADIDEAIAVTFEKHHDQTYSYTCKLIASLKEKGYLIFAISGSHQEIVTRLGAHYGFDDTIGARYHVIAGKFTGTRTTPVVTGKGPLLKELVAKHGATWEKSLAIGDSRSDGAMLELVEQPVAFNPDQKLYTLAEEHGWPIVIERKNMAYRLEMQDGQYLLTDAGAA